MIAAACGGGSSRSGGGGGGGKGDVGAQFDKVADEGTPKRGGKVVYGLEAENNPANGYCPPQGQWAAPAIQVGDAIFDTLTTPASDGEGGVKYVPFLAESLEHNDTYTEWTIGLREGITFHDDVPLNAEAVKLNLDTFRGMGAIPAPLFSFVFEKVSAVDVVDDLTVKVTTEVPFVGFDALLWGTGRIAMASPNQLNNPATCPRQPIGTGPFMCVGECWAVDDHFTATANPNYWREDANGEQLPYLDEIEFRPVVEVAQRVNGLKGGELDVIHTTDGQQISVLRSDAEAGDINLLESDFAPETSYTMLNVDPEKSPFSSQNARLAVAHAVNMEEIIQITQDGIVERSVQPFGEDNIAYVDPEELGYPEYDPEKAKEFLEAWKTETGQSVLTFELKSTTDPGTIELARLATSQIQESLGDGVSVTLDQVEQAQLITQALSGDFNAFLWRNHPGGDPGTQFVWWYSVIESGADNFVNFNRIKDPEIDRLFDEGRAETDPAARAEIYQGISKRFAEQAYNIWGWYTLWAFAAGSDIHGLFPPENPDGSEPVIIASVQPVVGLWRD